MTNITGVVNPFSELPEEIGLECIRRLDSKELVAFSEVDTLCNRLVHQMLPRIQQHLISHVQTLNQWIIDQRQEDVELVRVLTSEREALLPLERTLGGTLRWVNARIIHISKGLLAHLTSLDIKALKTSYFLKEDSWFPCLDLEIRNTFDVALSFVKYQKIPNELDAYSVGKASALKKMLDELPCGGFNTIVSLIRETIPENLQVSVLFYFCHRMPPLDQLPLLDQGIKLLSVDLSRHKKVYVSYAAACLWSIEKLNTEESLSTKSLHAVQDLNADTVITYVTKYVPTAYQIDVIFEFCDRLYPEEKLSLFQQMISFFPDSLCDAWYKEHLELLIQSSAELDFVEHVLNRLGPEFKEEILSRMVDRLIELSTRSALFRPNEAVRMMEKVPVLQRQNWYLQNIQSFLQLPVQSHADWACFESLIQEKIPSASQSEIRHNVYQFIANQYVSKAKRDGLDSVAQSMAFIPVQEIHTLFLGSTVEIIKDHFVERKASFSDLIPHIERLPSIVLQLDVLYRVLCDALYKQGDMELAETIYQEHISRRLSHDCIDQAEIDAIGAMRLNIQFLNKSIQQLVDRSNSSEEQQKDTTWERGVRDQYQIGEGVSSSKGSRLKEFRPFQI